MLKFIKYHMTEIEGIEIYPIISLIDFLSVFYSLFWWVFSSKKEYLDRVSQIPLEKRHITKSQKTNIMKTKLPIAFIRVFQFL